MQKIRKYSGWQNHVSRTAVVASDTLDHDLDACHIFIYETSRVSSIKNKKTNHTTLGQGTEASNGMKDSIKVL